MDEGERWLAARCVTASRPVRQAGGRRLRCEERTRQRRKLAHSLHSHVRPRPIYPIAQLYSIVDVYILLPGFILMFRCGVALCDGAVSAERMVFVYCSLQCGYFALFVFLC